MKQFCPFIYSIILWLTISAAQLHGQTLAAVYHTGNSPLPDNEVRCVAVDAVGTVWVGTENGLAAFNGSTWMVYTTGNSPLPDNRVRSIAIDAANRLWFGTFNGGLAMYDNNVWTIFNTGNSGLSDNYVKSIAFDAAQQLWLGLSGGLATYDGINWQLFTAIGEDVLLNNVNDVIFDQMKDIWVCTVNGGLVSMSKNGLLYAFNLGNSGVPDNTLLAITADAQNVKWMTTITDGVGRYDGMGWQVFTTANSGIASNNTTDIYANPFNSNIYIGTTNAGLSVYHPPSNGWTTFTAGLPDVYITAITTESNGNIWLGTKTGGLVLLQDDFTNAPTLSPDKITLYPNPTAQQICLNLPAMPTLLEASVIAAASGKCLIHQTLTDACLSVGHLPVGLYFLHLRSDDGEYFVMRFTVVQ